MEVPVCFLCTEENWNNQFLNDFSNKSKLESNLYTLCARTSSLPQAKNIDMALTSSVTHIAIQKYLDGRAADWMEHVSDEQYDW